MEIKSVARSNKVLWVLFLVISIALIVANVQNRKIERLNNGRYEQLALENKNLQAMITQYRLTTHEAGVYLRLTEELLKVPAWREKLGPSLPYVANKAIELSKRHRDIGLTLPLILGLIESESNFNPRAISPAYAYGLTQVLRSTSLKYLHERDHQWSENVILAPELNMEVGIQFLVDLHDGYMSRGIEKREEWHMSITSYFWGERLASQTLGGASKDRVSFPSMAYWSKVRDAQTRWEKRGFE